MKRYRIDSEYHGIEEEPQGEYVLYSDVELLVLENKALFDIAADVARNQADIRRELKQEIKALKEEKENILSAIARAEKLEYERNSKDGKD